MYRHKKNKEKSKMRALWSQTSFGRVFSKDSPRFSILDIYKCPFSKTQFTFWNFFVIESYSQIC